MKSGDHFDFCNRILLSIQTTPKSVKEISAETKIRITTVYKMMSILEKNNLVLVTGVFHKYGRCRLFQCNGSFKSAHIILHNLF
ncbi:MAG: hypothetical protein MAG458_01642 [Nitrosopumilus sp.]|nr:hypothetical protein [Nitrosopumilus sp.]